MNQKPIAKPSKPIKAKTGKKIAVSAGVIAGNRLSGMTPQYPAMTKAKKEQGAVTGSSGRKSPAKK
jgi:hypothetical protein